jgi:hypothetical protein
LKLGAAYELIAEKTLAAGNFKKAVELEPSNKGSGGETEKTQIKRGLCKSTVFFIKEIYEKAVFFIDYVFADRSSRLFANFDGTENLFKKC